MTREQFQQLRDSAPSCEVCGDRPAVFAEELRPWEARGDAAETKSERTVCRDCSGTVEVHGSRRNVWVVVGPAPGGYAAQEYAKFRLMRWMEQETASTDIDGAINAIGCIVGGLQSIRQGRGIARVRAA